MSDLRRRRLSYLLRLWQTEQEGTLVWRASLQSAHTGQRQGFASLAELYAFPEKEIAAADEPKQRLPSDQDMDARNQNSSA